MNTRRIGPLEVSVAGLGCNNFGMRLDAEATRLGVTRQAVIKTWIAERLDQRAS